MPETLIGHFPDLGASHFLSRLPGHFGNTMPDTLSFLFFSLIRRVMLEIPLTFVFRITVMAMVLITIMK